MSTKSTKKAVTRKAQPKTQPEVTPIPKRARGASKVAEAAARRPVPVPPTAGLQSLLPRVPKSARAKADAKKTATAAAPKTTGKRVSGDAIAVVPEVSKMERAARLIAAKAEHETMRDWASKGKKGAPPATPVLDWLKENPSGSVQRRQQIRKASKATNPRVTCTVRYFANGREMGEASQSLSSVAYQHTAGIDQNAQARISTSDLRTLLGTMGVPNPETTEWEVTLSNGKTLSAKLA